MRVSFSKQILTNTEVPSCNYAGGDAHTQNANLKSRINQYKLKIRMKMEHLAIQIPFNF